ncbi:MAG: ATP-dependent Clp protease ATP-binding subunit ClpX, partial [Candidatus Aminicenantaceae bacterium]
NIIKKRLGKKMIGFDSELAGKTDEKTEYSDILQQVVPEDIIEYGMIPEMVGRIPVISIFSDLSVKDLIDILTKPKNAIIKQYQKLFEMEDVKLEFTKEALNSIALRSTEKKLGARGLRSIIEDLMLDLMFHLPSSKHTSTIRITKKMVEDNSLVYDSLKQAAGE